MVERRFGNPSIVSGQIVNPGTRVCILSYIASVAVRAALILVRRHRELLGFPAKDRVHSGYVGGSHSHNILRLWLVGKEGRRVRQGTRAE
jgi:hypothetical protein